MIEIVFAMDPAGLIAALEKKKEVLKKNIIASRSDAEKKLYEITRNEIRRSNAKATKKIKSQLFAPDGTPINKSISSFMKGKEIGRGKMDGPPVMDPQKTQEFKWTKTAAGKASSHRSGRAGRDDRWLRNAVRTVQEGDTIYVFVNPDAGRGVASEPAALMPNLIEQGGSYRWKRNIPVGYVVESFEGVMTKSGDGKTLNRADKNSKMRTENRQRTSIYGKKFMAGSDVRASRQKNKSGKTRKAHFRKFNKTRVSFRKKFDRLEKTSSMPKESFIAPAIQTFLEKHFGLMAEKILNALKEG